MKMIFGEWVIKTENTSASRGQDERKTSAIRDLIKKSTIWEKKVNMINTTVEGHVVFKQREKIYSLLNCFFP